VNIAKRSILPECPFFMMLLLIKTTQWTSHLAAWYANIVRNGNFSRPAKAELGFVG
jgi:hypothetical protein